MLTHNQNWNQIGNEGYKTQLLLTIKKN